MSVVRDPRDILEQSPMSRLQYIIIGITVGLNALDGFDIMAISFAGPGIVAQWGLSNSGLGFVLAMELLGMALGSVFLGGLSDKVGRKPTIMGCLLAMTLGMFMVTVSSSLVELSIWRIITGLGIGGMLASLNATAAEFSNGQKRGSMIAAMSIGYPVGGVVGGTAVSVLLQYYDWRVVFYFGTVVSALFIPIVYFVLPESVHWLTRKQPVGALEKINATMKHLGHQAIEALPIVNESDRKKSTSELFTPRMVKVTILVTAAYFCHVITLYYILKWVPNLVVEMGFAPSSAAGVLTMASVGGALGCVFFGVLALKFDLKKLTIFTFILAWACTALFGQAPADLMVLGLLVALAGFFTNAGIVGMYSILAVVFPTHARASGTGFAVGIGRGGSVLSPIIAGFLLDGGITFPVLSVFMGIGSVIAALILLSLTIKSGDEVAKEDEVSVEKVAG